VGRSLKTDGDLKARVKLQKEMTRVLGKRVDYQSRVIQEMRTQIAESKDARADDLAQSTAALQRLVLETTTHPTHGHRRVLSDAQNQAVEALVGLGAAQWIQPGLTFELTDYPGGFSQTF
jgi:hypothetical protein